MPLPRHYTLLHRLNKHGPALLCTFDFRFCSICYVAFHTLAPAFKLILCLNAKLALSRFLRESGLHSRLSVRLASAASCGAPPCRHTVRLASSLSAQSAIKRVRIMR